MSKHSVLVSGKTIAKDQTLRKELEKFADVFMSDNNTQIESILRGNKVDLIILEISNASLHEIEVIKIVKTTFSDIEIILVDGDANQEVVAQAFVYGAKDAFRKPYIRSMITERVEALLKQKHIQSQFSNSAI